MQNEFPRCPICGSTGGYEVSGMLSNYARCYACNSKWKMSLKEQRISTLTLHELPKDGSGLYGAAGTNAPLYSIFGMPLPIEFWKNLKLDGAIDWVFLSASVDPYVAESVIQEKGEKLLTQWNGTRTIRGTKVKGGNTMNVQTVQLGSLLLTTRRLIWLERRTTGFLKQTTSCQVVYEMQLENVRGISGETGDSSKRTLLRRVSITDTNMENTFGLTNAFLELFKPIVESAIEMRRKEIDVEEKRKRISVTLDFSFLKAYMEKGGLIMQALKCPECGASVELPKGGTETRCTHCGNTLHAQDIFEKMKKLIE